MYVYIHVSMYVCTHVSIYVYICIHAHIYVCMHIYMFVYIHTYILYTHRRKYPEREDASSVMARVHAMMAAVKKQ